LIKIILKNKIVGLGWGFQNFNPFPNFQLRLRAGGIDNKTSSHKITKYF
tara:strand:- start:422 stop:568 length:147 start_codon:yes stop_codon:yes gene_type:complete